MRLIAKEEQTADGKSRGPAKAKKAANRAEAPAKAKKADMVRKGEVSKKGAKKSPEAGKPFIDAARDYLRDVVAELKKVVWPTRKETLGSTAVILVIIILSGVFLGLVDTVWSKLLHLMVH
jgi:preprotein translocase subunit SecE